MVEFSKGNRHISERAGGAGVTFPLGNSTIINLSQPPGENLPRERLREEHGIHFPLEL